GGGGGGGGEWGGGGAAGGWPRAGAGGGAACWAGVPSQYGASPPIFSATARAASRLTSRHATRAPARASSVAVAAPRPEAPPVTMAACPLMSMVNSSVGVGGQDFR